MTNGKHKKVPSLPIPKGGDKRAQKEAEVWDDLEEHSQKAWHKRRENFRDVIHGIILHFIRGAWYVLAGVGLVWVYHLVAPESWHWLSESGLDRLQTIFVSALVSAALTMISVMGYSKGE